MKIFRKFLIFLLLFSIVYAWSARSFYSYNSRNVNLQKAYLDLSNSDLSMIHVLNGDWEFHWMKTPDEINPAEQKKFSLLPGHWNKETGKGLGYATYRIRMKCPVHWSQPIAIQSPEQDSSFAIYANGKALGAVGTPSKDSISTEPNVKTGIFVLPYTIDGMYTIDLFVSNFSHRKGGAWQALRISNARVLIEDNITKKLRDGFIASAMGVVFLFFLVIWIVGQREVKITGVMLFSGALFFRTISTDERILTDFYPIPYFFMVRLEYLSWFWALPFLYLYFSQTFPLDFSEKIGKFFQYISLVFSLALFLPSILFTYTAVIYPIFFFANGFILIYYFGHSFLKKRKHSERLGLSLLILALAATNDVAHALGIVYTSYYSPEATLIFIAMQVITFAHDFSDVLKKERSLNEHISKLNHSYSRYVPKEFFDIIRKSDQNNQSLDEGLQKKTVILMIEITNFSKLPQSLDTNEEKNLYDFFSELVETIVHRNGGFVEKFSGDSIFALFMEKRENAFLVAKEIQRSFREAKNDIHKENSKGIEIGIGIHISNLTIYESAEKKQKYGKELAEIIDLLSKIIDLTKVFRTGIILSANAFIEVPDTLKMEFRLLDRVSQGGAKESIFVVEMIDSYSEEMQKEILTTRTTFTLALDAYRRKDFEEAEKAFQALSREYPNDTVLQRFYEMSRESSLKKLDRILAHEEKIWDS